MCAMMYFYHYTNQAGFNGIRSSKYIKESSDLDAGDDARFGTGVYLTTVPPSAGKKAIIITCWGHNAYPAFARNGRVDYVIRIQMSRNHLREATSKGDVYLHEGVLHLNKYHWQGEQVPNMD